MRHIKKLLVIMAIATLILSMAIATASATSQVKSEKKDTEIVKIESKEKTTKYKITWNGNGGKIGTKKTVTTNVKKGSKIGKLTTPKRSGYSFKGWYTKKTGGTKITKSTKPKKSATLYARWQKKSSSRVLNAEEKKLVGLWKDSFFGNRIAWDFKKDGTFYTTGVSSTGAYLRQGQYSLKNGVLTLLAQGKTQHTTIKNWDAVPWGKWSTDKIENVKFSTYDGKQYLNMRGMEYVKVSRDSLDPLTF